MGAKEIIIRGLSQNNLKHISLKIPKEKIVVFTGVSGSGKSSIVFDTIASESQRQMNETYTAWIRGRLPKFEKARADAIENLSASVIVDQTRLGGNARSTVGTISELYSALRVLYSRLGQPYVGTASFFSFNDPNGMCPECSGLGRVVELDLTPAICPDKSWNEDMVDLPAFHVGTWYWKQYTGSGLFDLDKKYRDYSEKEKNRLLYGADERGGKRLHKNVEGLYLQMSRLLLKREIAENTERSILSLQRLVVEGECSICGGRRLNARALSCKVAGASIDELCAMEFTALRDFLSRVQDPGVSTLIESLQNSLTRLIDIGLPYLSMARESSTLSGGEAQRLKLVRYMGSALTGMIYIFDEPSTGMHPRDVYRMTSLLKSLRDKGNSVLVVEHDKDVIAIADEVIDVGPLAGKGGGEIVFQGSYEALLKSSTLTGEVMRQQIGIKENPRLAKEFLSIRDASIHNLKAVSVDIPLNIFTVVTGVAGSGKSSLIRDVFAKLYEDRVILVDQSPITATVRSNPATFLGFFDEIRKLISKANDVPASLFSFNSKGACELCKGKGVVTTELVFMDPVTTECESCAGERYSAHALSFRYKSKRITEILALTAKEAYAFFEDSPKIRKSLQAMIEVGLSYLSLGQALSTLSGGERQRIKLAKYLDKKGNIYVLDEPTTGLHGSDLAKLMKLFNNFVNRNNTVIVIEHNMDVVKQADYIIDMGPDGGSSGGTVVFTGSPSEMIKHGTSITADFLRKSLESSE